VLDFFVDTPPPTPCFAQKSSESVENKGSALQKVAKSSQNAENTQLESKPGLENRKRLIFRGLGVMRRVRTRRNTEELARAAQPGATSVVTTIPYFTIHIINYISSN
jgi:hypothetical protein